LTKKETDGLRLFSFRSVTSPCSRYRRVSHAAINFTAVPTPSSLRIFPPASAARRRKIREDILRVVQGRAYLPLEQPIPPIHRVGPVMTSPALAVVAGCLADDQAHLDGIAQADETIAQFGLAVEGLDLVLQVA